jgi:hypothetical protein
MTQLDLGLVGRSVAAITLDTSVAIIIGEDRENTLRVERAFRLDVDGAVVTVEFSPIDGVVPRGLDTLATVIGSVVTGSEARADGSLIVSFWNEVTLTVEPDENYEAWTLTGPSGVLVSLPGGGLG